MDEKFAIMFMMAALVLGVVTIVRLTLEHMSRSKVVRTQGEVYNRLIDKFGSSGDLLTYLQSEAGQQLLKSPAVPAPNSYSRIMNAAQYGAVAAVTGFGILGIGRAFTRSEVADVAFVVGWMGVTVGVALLISAALSYLLSKRFGLINGGGEVN